MEVGRGASTSGPEGTHGTATGLCRTGVCTASVPGAQGRTMTVENPAAPTEVEAKPHGVELTDTAAGKAKALLDQEGRNDMSLRIAVQPGGCAGLKYQLFFDDR